MPTSSSQPNIILITTDQQRGDCLGIDEQAPAALQTPCLDHLARSGVRFRRGYSECPSCFPARRSLMTGTAPAAQGMVGMAASRWDPPHTLAGELGKAGYHTYLVGKLHLQPSGKRFGFDHQELADSPGEMGQDYARWLRDVHGRTEADAPYATGQSPNGWTAMPNYLPPEQTHTFWCTSRAINFLQYHRDPTAPFFLNLSYFDPHPPITPPQAYYDRYINRELPEPAVGDWAQDWDQPTKGLSPDAWRIRLDKQQMQTTRAGYYATVNFIDDQIGRLLQFVQRAGLLQDTIILFTSDHGEMLGDHHLYRKCWPYEGSARVPMILRVPPKFGGKPDFVSDQPVGLQDVMPTLLDLAGAPTPEACTGRSFAPLARGQREHVVRDVLHGEHAGQYDYNDGMHYLVSDRYKYVWYSQHGGEHLFDLRDDPMELRDMALQPDAEAALSPWRERMAAVLRDRPEGFVKDGKLTPGAPHQKLLPDLAPDRFYSYL